MKETDLTTYKPISRFATVITITSLLEAFAVCILGIVLSIAEFWWMFIPLYIGGGIGIVIFYASGMLIASYVSNVYEIKESINAIATKEQPKQAITLKKVNSDNIEKDI